ncbi:hypothetical protein BpHYR1_030796 [Brachionus plicatilis]|uniref:Uncharacterized protein n=1 Tax=Brachionus plicatilis TaxID=10195 RepID=A0A3M7PQZ6_BRAPC|nr:hypothetical protein BpHYR1_030796 [Brachionus plicatilis]
MTMKPNKWNGFKMFKILENLRKSYFSKELLFKRAQLIASIKKGKKKDKFLDINQSKKSEGRAKNTLQERIKNDNNKSSSSSKTLKYDDVLQKNLGFELKETRNIKFKVNDIPKSHGNG